MAVLASYETKFLIDFLFSTTLRYSSDDVIVDGVFYKGGLANEPGITKQVEQISFGDTLRIEINDADHVFAGLLATQEMRRAGVKIRRYEPGDSPQTSFECYGLITGYNLLDKVSFDIAIQDPDPLQTLLPQKLYETGDWAESPPNITNPAPDLGKPYAIPFGNCKKVPFRYVHSDQTSGYYDYICRGPVQSCVNVYSNKALVDPVDYVFYNGTQVSPYPGYAVIRFSFVQTDFNGTLVDVHADINGMLLGGASAQRNYARVIQHILNDATWGLNQTINATSFAAAATALDTIGSLYCDMCLSSQRPAQDILNDLLYAARADIEKNDAGEWVITVDTNQTSTSLDLGDDASGRDNIREIITYQKTPSREATKNLTLLYAWNEWEGTYYYKNTRSVNATLGENRQKESPCIRDHTTADKTTCYRQRLETYGDTKLVLRANMEARKLTKYQTVNVSISRLGINGVFQVRKIKRGLTEFTLHLISYNALIHTYAAGTLPNSANPDDEADYSQTDPTAPTNLAIDSSGTYLTADGFKSAYTIVRANIADDAVEVLIGYRKNGETIYTYVPGALASGTTWKARIAPLGQAVGYDYIALCVNVFGRRSTVGNPTLSNQAAPADTTGPAAPTNVQSTTGTGKLVTIKWDKNTEDDVKEYPIFRRTDANPPQLSDWIGDASRNRFDDTQVVIGTTYRYYIGAQDSSENPTDKLSNVTAAPAATPGQVSADLTGVYGIDLVRDGTLEVGDITQHWNTIEAPTKISLVTTPVHTGQYAMRMEGIGSMYGVYNLGERFNRVEVGETYFLRYFHRHSAGAVGMSTVYLAFYAADKVTLIGTDGPGWLNPGTSYTERTKACVVPVGAHFMAWTAAVWTDMSAGEYAYFDDISLRRQLTADDVVDTGPAAPVIAYNSEGAYNAGSGRTFAYINISVTHPTENWAGTNLIYRRLGETGWMIAAQDTTVIMQADELTPGLIYQIAARGYSPFGTDGTISNIVERLAPGDTTRPNQVTGMSGTGKFKTWHFQWTPSTADDLYGYHIQIATDAGFTNIVYDNMPSASSRPVSASSIDYTSDVLGFGTLYCRVKAVDYTGNESLSWSATASATTSQAQTGDYGDGTVTAPKLVIGLGVNICHPRYVDFEENALPPLATANCTVALDATDAYFGSKCLRLTSTATDGFCVLSPGGSEYNIRISPNKKWILSGYVRSVSVGQSGEFYVITAAGAYNVYFTITSTAWTRFYGVVDLTADASKSCYFRVDNNVNGVIMKFDGLMMEEAIGSGTTPSAFSMPGQTIIDLDQITTGVLRIQNGSVVNSSFGGTIAGVRDGKSYFYNASAQVICEIGDSTYAVQRIVNYNKQYGMYIDSANGGIQIIADGDYDGIDIYHSRDSSAVNGVSVSAPANNNAIHLSNITDNSLIGLRVADVAGVRRLQGNRYQGAGWQTIF